LNYLTIEMAPLRERPEDIEPLVRYFLNQQQQAYGVTKAISDSAMRKLKGHFIGDRYFLSMKNHSNV
jgi:DNA-binding NtrC family response regulator